LTGAPTAAHLSRFERLKEALLASSSDFLFWTNREGTILDAYFPGQANVQPGPVVGRAIKDLTAASVGKQVLLELALAMERGIVTSFWFRYMIHRRMRRFEARIAPAGNGEALLLVRDVTDLYRLQRRITLADESARKKLGEDLHDSLGPQLSGIKYLCTALVHKANTGEAISVEELRRVEDQVARALLQARGLAKDYFGVAVDQDGLVPALRELAHRTESFYVKCDLRGRGEIVLENKMTATELYHIAQESVQNALKHGRAKNISIELDQINQFLRLSVTDDGVGFIPPLSNNNQGVGLQIMRFRARRIGATLELASTPNHGTVVTCMIPVIKST
jgi:signal transduction histidine kinase